MSIYDVGGQPNKISVSQAVQYAQQAGFSGTALINAVAIAMAESGLDANSTNTTTSGVGLDRGIVKFNSVFHKEIPDSCAYDPQCAFKAMYSISQGGTNFNEWCTYNAGCANPPNNNGPYKRYVPQVTAAVAGLPQTGAGTPFLQSNPFTNFQQWGEYIAVFAIAVVLLFMGLYLLAEKQVVSATQRVTDAALKLTV